MIDKKEDIECEKKIVLKKMQERSSSFENASGGEFEIGYFDFFFDYPEGIKEKLCYGDTLLRIFVKIEKESKEEFRLLSTKPSRGIILPFNKFSSDVYWKIKYTPKKHRGEITQKEKLTFIIKHNGDFFIKSSGDNHLFNVRQNTVKHRILWALTNEFIRTEELNEMVASTPKNIRTQIGELRDLIDENFGEIVAGQDFIKSSPHEGYKLGKNIILEKVT